MDRVWNRMEENRWLLDFGHRSPASRRWSSENAPSRIELSQLQQVPSRNEPTLRNRLVARLASGVLCRGRSGIPKELQLMAGRSRPSDRGGCRQAPASNPVERFLAVESEHHHGWKTSIR